MGVGPTAVAASETFPLISGGGQPDPDCGTWAHLEACPGPDNTCGDPKGRELTCDSRDCPDCYEAWRAERVAKATERVAGLDLFAALLEGDTLDSWDDLTALRWMHLEISTQEDQEGVPLEEDYKASRDRAKELAAEAGLEGWALIPHHYRIRDEAKERLTVHGYGNDDLAPGQDTATYWIQREPHAGPQRWVMDPETVTIQGRPGTQTAYRGLWEGVRDDALERDHWGAYATPGLHWHVVGFTGRRWTHADECPTDGPAPGPDCLRECDRLHAGDKVGEDTDVVKRLRDLDTLDDLRATLSYVLDHATPPEGRHTVTWAGALSYNRWSPDPEKRGSRLTHEEYDHLLETLAHEDDEDEEDEPCEHCGSRDRIPIWDAQDLWENNTLEHGRRLKLAYLLQARRDDLEDALEDHPQAPDLPPPDDPEAVDDWIDGDWPGATSVLLHTLNPHLDDTQERPPVHARVEEGIA